jgi:preprotein translocase subunit SecA
MQWLLKKIVGSKIERERKRLAPIVRDIVAEEEKLQQLSDDQVKAKTAEFKTRLADGETLDDILVEAFAVVKNACRRCVGDVYQMVEHDREWVEIPYDVQLIGGIALHQGKIAEMATGEGKTLVACAPVYLNALAGKGVHVVTVNDYLAKRDSMWMGHIYEWLGLTIGCIQHDHNPEEKRDEYNCDITYGTNSEFGFDYLRDNMTYRREHKVHRDYNFAIIDEIDSILIDEAKTPLIIAGLAPNSNIEQFGRLKPKVEALYKRQKKLIDSLIKDAKDLLDRGEEEEAGFLLYQIQQGMPKNAAYMKLVEEPEIRRLSEKTGNNMLTDMWKEKARELREGMFFTIDEKSRDAGLTDQGAVAMSPDNPEMYELPDIVTLFADLEGDEVISPDDKHAKRMEIQDSYNRRSEDIHAIDQLIRAYCLYEKDIEYMVQNNQVVIVDTNTGRAMPGRRWSDGLHQAVEAKEAVKVEDETQTMATITIQNYFRMYDKLAGMTGTAETEAQEFQDIYGLDVMVIPTNRPVRRLDFNDPIYKTRREKNIALLEEVVECYERKQPVLVGTVTVEASEELSRLLNRRKIPHSVLNAKHHQAEAEVVARAGQPGSITIATNMAGRGTDIKLGEGVVKMNRDEVMSQTALSDPFKGMTLEDWLIENPSGLHVLGTERHESRRIDRQLRGRCARQGDPGSSRFYVSLEDDLMRLFGSERISKIMSRLGMEEGEVLEHPWLNKSIERAQKKVEELNFSRRKRTLEYDDVMNRQREIVYGLRSELLVAEDVRPKLYEIIEETIQEEADVFLEDRELGPQQFVDWVNMTFPIGMTLEHIGIDDPETAPVLDVEEVISITMAMVRDAYKLKIETEESEEFRDMERMFMIRAIDNHWQEYLRAMDQLKEGIGLVGIGQRDPLVEFKREAYGMFADLMGKIQTDICQSIFRFSTSRERMDAFFSRLGKVEEHHDTGGSAIADTKRQVGQQQQQQGQQKEVLDDAIEQARTPVRRNEPKVGRNDPCPCGSGKKYKKCCGVH